MPKQSKRSQISFRHHISFSLEYIIRTRDNSEPVYFNCRRQASTNKNRTMPEVYVSVCSVATDTRSLLLSTKIKQTNICEEHGHNLLLTSHLRLPEHSCRSYYFVHKRTYQQLDTRAFLPYAKTKRRTASNMGTRCR